MSIPLYFRAIFIDRQGTVAPRGKENANYDVVVDGGFLANFPIKIFDSTRYKSKEGSNSFEISDETVGFRIDSRAQIENDKHRDGLAALKISNLGEYSTALYIITLENLNRQLLTEEDWKRTVSINDGEIGPRLKKLSKENSKKLVTNGYIATQQFLGISSK